MDSLIYVMEEMGLLIVLGAGLRCYALLSAQGVRELSSLAVNITCPLLVLASVCRMQSSSYEEVLMLLGVGTAIYLLLPFVAGFLSSVMHVEAQQQGAYRFMFIFSNTSLLGFPLVQAIFGDEAVFYTAVLHMPFDVLVYSYGMYLMGKGEKKLAWKNLWNPGLVLTVLALLVYICQWQVPALVADTSYLLGNITTPVSMLVIGASLAEIQLRSIFTEVRLYIMMAVRLLGIPALVYACLTVGTNLSYELIAIATITFGMPVGSMLVMLAQEFQNQTALAVKAVSLTTLGAIISVPLLLQLLAWGKSV